MRPNFNQSQRAEVGLNVKVDPRVVLSSQILAMTQQELEYAIESELNENPALERLQDDLEPLSEEIILKVVAPQELKPSSEDFEFYKSIPRDTEQPNWVELTASSTTLGEHLRAQLLPMLPDDLQELGEFLVESLNEKGYLDEPVEEIALATDRSIEEVEEVLVALQGCEPAGVGARDLQECLLLQLRDVAEVEEKLAKLIVKSHMDEFVARKPNKIVRKYKVHPEVVEKAFDVILALAPYPGETFRSSSAPNHDTRSAPVTPDLTLTREENGWMIQVKGADPNYLCVDRAYRKRFHELNSGGKGPKEEKNHVNAYVQRASNFIQSLQQRRETMKKIGEYLVQHQSGFISTGSYQFLQPLTRSKMAAELDLHESTISRATMSKFVQISNGEVVPFEVFFKPALRVQKMIEEILQTENPNNPLSDEVIAQMLAKKGVEVARRTVNKYRDRVKLLSSRKRRTA